MSEAKLFPFAPGFNRAIKVRSRDLRVTSDAGLLLVREADHRLDLTSSLAQRLHDSRDPGRVRYELLELLRERVYGLAQGYRSADDLDVLAHDPALRLAVWDRPGDRVLTERLASQPTQSRLTDTLSSPQNREALRSALGDWVARHALASSDGARVQRATLDIDSHPIEVHGAQEGGEHNGYYQEKIYHPIVAAISPGGDFDTPRLGDGFVAARLRHGKADSAEDAIGFLGEAIEAGRRVARSVDVRFDAAFGDAEILDALHSWRIHFVGRLGRNSVLDRLATPHLVRPQGRPPKEGYERVVELIDYRAETWQYAHRVILVVIDRPDPETGQLELFPHYFFLVTSWSPEERSAREILEHYRRRGTFEDRIGELRGAVLPNLSSPRFEENEVHMLLGLLAYNLVSMLRSELEITGATGWDLARVQRSVLKAGALVVRSSRRVLVDLACAASVLWARLIPRIARWRLPASFDRHHGPRSREWRPPPRHAFLAAVLRE